MEYDEQLNCNRSNSFLFVNGVNIYQFKAKKPDINLYSCLGNISKEIKFDKITKTGLNGYVNEISVDCNSADISNIVDIHKYLMKKHNIRKC